jgi:hypothetical protein
MNEKGTYFIRKSGKFVIVSKEIVQVNELIDRSGECCEIIIRNVQLCYMGEKKIIRKPRDTTSLEN